MGSAKMVGALLLAALFSVELVVGQQGTILVHHPDCILPSPICAASCRDPDRGIENCVRIAFTTSGKAGNSAREMSLGYQFWAQKVNDEGGIADQSQNQKIWFIELTVFEDNGEPGEAAQFYRTAAISQDLSMDFDAYFGPYSSNSNLQVLHALDTLDSNVQPPLLISNSPSGFTLTVPRDYVVGVMSEGHRFLEPALVELANQGATTVAALYNPENSFSESVFLGALENMHDLGMTLVGSHFFRAGDTSDQFEDYLKDLRKTKADVLLAATTGSSTIPVMEGLRKAKFKPNAVLMTSAATDNMLNTMGDDSQHLLSTVQWHPTLSSMIYFDDFFGSPQEFSDEYVAKMEPTAKVANYHAASAAAAGLVLQHAIASKDTLDGAFDRELIKNRMRQKVFDGSFYGPIEFDQFGRNDRKDIVITQVHEDPKTQGNLGHFVVSPSTSNEIHLVYPADFNWSGSSGWFGTFVLVIFIIVLVLCVAGCAFKYSKGARGSEMVPGIEGFRTMQEKMCSPKENYSTQTDDGMPIGDADEL